MTVMWNVFVFTLVAAFILPDVTSFGIFSTSTTVPHLQNQQRNISQIDEDGTTEYSLFPSVSSRFCSNKRSNLPPRYFGDDLPNPNCLEKTPLSILQYGRTPLRLSDDRQFGYDRVFDFTCISGISNDNPLRQFGYNSVPKEVDQVVLVNKTRNVTREISSENLVNVVMDELIQNRIGNSFVSTLKDLGFDGISKNEKFTSSEFTKFVVTLSRNVKPTPRILEAFRNLPAAELNADNIQPYFDFINVFGSHIMLDAEFGANMAILQEPHSTSIIYRGNASKLENTRRPVLLNGTYVPIHQILEAEEKTVRTENFNKILQFEYENSRLQRLQFLLHVLPQKSNLSTYLTHLIATEAEMRCPNPEMVKIIEQQVIRSGNLMGNKFGMDCNGRNVNRSFNLISGVCLNAPLSNKRCDKVTFRFPEAVKCLVAYESNGCNENGKSHFVKNESEMIPFMQSVRSFRFCTAAESQNLLKQ